MSKRLSSIFRTVLVAGVCATIGSACNGNPVVDLEPISTLAVANAPGAIRVITDDHGVRHIYGDGLAATLYAQGYIVAKDRFWQMDLTRRFGTGRLSAAFGEPALETDVEMRGAFLTRNGDPLEQALSDSLEQEFPAEFALAQAYADGVNAYLSDMRAGANDAVLPLEYDHPLVNVLAEEIPDWTVADTMAIARVQAWFLSQSHHDEVARADAKAQLDPAVYADLYRFKPESSATTLNNTANKAAGFQAQGHQHTFQQANIVQSELAARIAPIAKQLVARQRRLPTFLPFFGNNDLDLGSNNWIVAPSASASGHALLANDPHLGLSNPPVWHVVHLDPTYTNDNDDVSVQGVSFPGIPGIILGFTDTAAWGGTVAGYDVTDVYVETLNDGKVSHKGKQVSLIRKNFDIEIKGLGKRTYPIDVVPHHGPMMPDPDLDDDVEGLAATNMSFRWTGHDITPDAVFILRLACSNCARSQGCD